MRYKIKKLRDDVEIPQYHTGKAAGFDLAVAEDTRVPEWEPVLLPTGLVIGAPSGHMLMLALRSSTPKKWGLMMPHGVGIVDEDYCGDEDEIKIQVIRLPMNRWLFEPVSLLIPKGTRIAQGIFVPVTQASPLGVDMMGESRGGFGSSG